MKQLLFILFVSFFFIRQAIAFTEQHLGPLPEAPGLDGKAAVKPVVALVFLVAAVMTPVKIAALTGLKDLELEAVAPPGLRASVGGN